MGQLVHKCIIESELKTYHSLLDAFFNMHSKCGAKLDARWVFEKIHLKGVLTYNILIAAYAQEECNDSAIEVLEEMQYVNIVPDEGSFVNVLRACHYPELLEKGKVIHTNIVQRGFDSVLTINTALIGMYGKCGRFQDACIAFYHMPKRDIVSCNSAIMACTLHGQNSHAFEIFARMGCDRIKPNATTFASTLTACSSFKEVLLTHTFIIEDGLGLNVFIGTTLVNTYGKCGSCKDAEIVFFGMSEQNVISWNAMIAVYAQHGLGQEALNTFKQMLIENVKPDEITFTSVLAACSHDGLLLEGCLIFSLTIGNNATSPSADHFSCIIDLLGRIGRLDEAENLINALPIEDVTSLYFLALLGSCRYQNDVERGERAAQQAFELDSEIPASYVLLSNLYVHANYDTTISNMGIECTH